MDTLIKDEQSAPVELLYDRPPTGLVAPETFVTWCVNQAVEGRIIKRKIKNPHLLIVIIKDGTECHRILKPLSDGGCFLRFNRSGSNDVHATVVWPHAEEDLEKFEARIMKPAEYGDGFDLNLMDRPVWSQDLDRSIEPGPRSATWKGPAGDQPVVILGLPEEAPGEDERYYYAIEGSDTRIPADEVEFPHGFREFGSLNRLFSETVETVDVDPELFAKPPRERTKRFVGFFPWGRKRAADQCDMRGQIIMSLLASPFVGLWWAVPRALAGFVCWLALAWLGYPKASLLPIVHPIREDFDDIWNHRERRSRWYLKEDGEEQPALFWFINPITVTVAFVPLAIVKAAVGFWPWWPVFAIGFGGPVAIFAVAAIIAGIVAVFPAVTKPVRWALRPLTKRWTASRKSREQRKQEEAKQAVTREYELISALACDQHPRGTRIRDVNGNLRKITSLFARRGKTKVCKVYSRD